MDVLGFDGCDRVRPVIGPRSSRRWRRRGAPDWDSPEASGFPGAFARALALDPDLSVAYEQLAYVDVELGLAAEAMSRLIDRVAERPRDPRLFAGLVTTCRYAGLLDASLAAHAKAVALDAAVRTTVCWTHFFLGDYAAAMRFDHGTPPFCSIQSQMFTGKPDPALLLEIEEQLSERGLRTAMRAYRLLQQGQIEPALEGFKLMDESGFADPEGWFLTAIGLARAGADAHALTRIAKSVDAGFAAHRALVERDHFDRLRGTAEFQGIVDRARARVDHAKRLYERAGGPAILGPAN